MPALNHSNGPFPFALRKPIRVDIMMDYRQVIASLLVLLLCWPAMGRCNEFVPDGFRGVPWKSDLSQRQDMVFHDRAGGISYYTRHGESLRLGNGDLLNLYYGAYNNRFYLVLAQFHGNNNREKIKYVFFREFGKPFKPDENRFDYAWTRGDVTATLMYEENTKTGTIIYSYDPIDHEINR